ncbi:hypothetical protein R3Q06_17610 [Rhodococcus erythropolis]|uniref:hypothetical protein n=1 Tax=Rhodococcus erythropolis TaxID=1833 RepID=UPI002948E0E4|nr:hypothetical protein [Rhodococcus erythropolis]MDV6275316.1 hypothetical protein [Rhodococcus erythropolis]
MAWLKEWFDTLGVGAVLLAIIAWLIGRRKGKADIGKIDSESGKIGVEAAQIIAQTATDLLVPLSERVGKLEARIEVLESENEHKTKLLDSAIRFIQELLRWIGIHVPEGTPPTIPPDLESEIQR